MFANQWYAIKSKPRKEWVLHQQLLIRNIECFFPRAKVKPINPRAAKLHPFFPGYMFVNVDIQESGVSEFQWMPYSMGLVGFGDEPGVIPDDVINALKKQIDQIRANGGLSVDQLYSGTPVRIIGGPFKGYDAVFDTRLDGEERVRVLMQMIDQRQVAVEMQVGQVASKT